MPEPYSRRDLGYMADVLIAARHVRDFVGTKGQKEFLDDGLVYSAVMHQFMVAGEAVKRISPEVRAERDEIDWSGIARFRDVLIHHYDRLDDDEVWRVIRDELPAVIAKLEALVPQPKE